MEVFFVCVILQPTAKQKHDEGAVAQIIVQPTAVMAKDENQAAMKAYKFIPDEHQDKTDRVEVKILPFRPIGTRP